MNIMVLMGGSSSSFYDAGYKFCKPLIEVGDKMIVEKVVNNLSQIITPDDNVTFIVKKEDNENFFHILKEYKKLNDHGILINTSFNKHGRTIVNTVERAIEDFIDCNIDKLYIGNYLIEKKVNNL